MAVGLEEKHHVSDVVVKNNRRNQFGLDLLDL